MTTHTPEGLREAVAQAVHKGRFPADREPTPWETSCPSDRAYCYRVAASVLAALPPNSRKQETDLVGAAEAEVGRYVYRRIEALMDAKPGTPDGAELDYLATIAASVEEYGEEACGGHSLAPSPAEPAKGSGELVAELRKAADVLWQADQVQYQNSIPTSAKPSILRTNASLMSRAADALSRPTGSEVPQGRREAVAKLDEFINEPPRMFGDTEPTQVREYRHALYREWVKFLAAAPPPEGRG